MAVKFAKRVEKLGPSEIDDILKVIENPNIISFAGGLPAPELFPVEEMKNVAVKVLEESGRQALQYSATDGFLPLREKIATRMNTKFGLKATAKEVLIVSGSQQALDFSGKIFINPGDVVLCESPSYFGAMQAFDIYGPKFVEVPTDNEGMIPEELEKILATTKNVSLIYAIPDFQNPTGITWTMERRKKIMEIVTHYEIPVIEDNPYGELRFEGETLPSLKALDTKDLVIFLGSFSKIFCPGFRIGWIIADETILAKYKYVKQAADLQTSTIAQREVNKFMELYDLDAHVEKIKAVYRKRRDLALQTMKKEFPEEVTFTYPTGGLFTWVEMPNHVKSKDVFYKGIENNVAIVPGDPFFPNGGKKNMFRMNYSNTTEEKIVEGISTLAKVLKELIQNK